jgi:hypothetical protein
MDLNAAMERLIRIGPSEAMREDERAMGFEPIRPGDCEWFSAADWNHKDVVSVRGREVRIVAIKATKVGVGAFSRMITGIARAGLTPIVVEPLFDMPDILQRWGWQRFEIGEGFEHQEIWKPRIGWLRARAALPLSQRGEK